MEQMYAAVLVVAILYAGDVVSIKTRALIPSVFICAVLFLFGYWTFFPKNIVEITGFATPIVVFSMYLLIVNMGTLLSVKKMMYQWKTILISFAGIFGVAVFVYLSCLLFSFDLNYAIVSIPPLVGGVVSSVIMSQAATNLGLSDLSVLAVITYVMQGFIGYPLTSILLKKEAKNVLNLYRSGSWNDPQESIEVLNIEEDNENKLPKLFSWLPENYNTIYFRIFRIVIVGAIAYFVSELLKPIVFIHPLVLCLLFGVIAASIGFLEKHPLQKANAFGLTLLGLMLFIFNPLSQATPEMLLRLAYPLSIFIFSSAIGMYIFSLIAGKLLNVSKEMAFAIALTAMYGFPADYIITNEVIKLMTKDKKEREVLTNHMLAPMLVGGFVSVTIVSVILAGFFVGLLTV